MRLEGSCHCGAVRFALESRTPVPYMRCYCTICRKTMGGGGYAINLSGDARTLTVTGEENISVYRVRRDAASEDAESEDGLSPARRHFCKRCGSGLWVFDRRWPALIHPFASAIDTPLPRPPETVHIMLAHAANWVDVPEGAGQRHFPEYPDLSIADWHDRHGLTDAEPPDPETGDGTA